jgi:hypothetical protein
MTRAALRSAAAAAVLAAAGAGVATPRTVRAQAQPATPAAPPTAPSSSAAPIDVYELEAPQSFQEAAAAEAAAESGPLDASLVDAQIRQNEQLANARRSIVSWGGYVDFGFFIPSGNGAGYVQDYGHARFPGAPYNGYSWVFLGDILAPAVNSRGEVADLGDAPGVDRYDSINSRGAAGFVVNEVNLRLRATPASNAIITASVNVTPRTGSNFSLGDVLDMDLAQLEWIPTESGATSIFVGKIESVLGIEYRDRKADRRFGITPSLIARYTTGTALGIKVRSKLGQGDRLILAAALTNGSNTTEQFHFYDETDSNSGKTGSARVAVRLPLPFPVEIGVSGSYGAQDRTTSNRHPMWFFGPDLIAELGLVDVKAAWLKGKAAGDPAQDVYQLDLKGGGYLEADAVVTPTLGILGRIEYRDAFVALGSDRAYITKSWRATVGVRLVLTAWATGKAEYLHNGEYDGLPGVRNDVFTSSLVLSY